MAGYRRAADLPQVIPVFPLDGALLLPGGELPLQIFEPRYLNRRELDIDWDTASAAPLEALVNSLAMGLPFEPQEKQALLQAPDLAARFDTLTVLLEIDSAEDGDDESPSVQ